MRVMDILNNARIEILEFSISCLSDELIVLLTGRTETSTFSICFFNVSCLNLKELSVPMIIQGFEIIDNKSDGWDNCSRFFIHDFEEGTISFYCENYELIS